MSVEPQAAAILRKAEEFVRRQHASDASGHDWWHIHRVRQNSLHIGRAEGADLHVVELAALFHDIADWKFHAGDTEAGRRHTRAWLTQRGAAPETIDHVCEIVAGVSFKGAGVDTPMQTLEGRVVQDADRLDALGAIGIARTFAYGGHAGQAMHDPQHAAVLHQSFDEYRTKTSTSINHFYEKLLLLKDRMQTFTGRRLAEQRHQYMEEFLNRFLAEWDGTA